MDIDKLLGCKAQAWTKAMVSGFREDRKRLPPPIISEKEAMAIEDAVLTLPEDLKDVIVVTYVGEQRGRRKVRDIIGITSHHKVAALQSEAVELIAKAINKNA